MWISYSNSPVTTTWLGDYLQYSKALGGARDYQAKILQRSGQSNCIGEGSKAQVE